MRYRTLPIALIIAASLTPVAGCSDNDGSANDQSQGTDLAAEQSADSSGQTSDNGSQDSSPIPVNDPNKTADTASTSPQSKPAPPAPDRVQQLAQQIASIKQANQKRLDQQAQRIDALEQQVAALTKRLRQRPQPTSAHAKPDQQKTNPAKTQAPDAVFPQSSDSAASRESKSDAGQSADASNNDESADDSDGEPASSDSPPASGHVTGPNIVAHCPAHGDAADQFDVFFQAATDDALGAAADQVQSAGLSDWFARASIGRLYVGRYGNCPLAARRRADVHERTGLALNIRAVAPHHAGTSKSTDHSPAHDDGAADNAAASIRRAATEPVQPVVTNAPFEVIGVELRGTHHFLGVAPHGVSRLSGVTWLSPGNAYGTWTLRAIRTDAGTATFAHGGRTIAVALPRRG